MSKTNQNTEKKDLYQEVTNSIIQALEAGLTPWVCPWIGAGRDRNAVSGHEYRGMNTILCWLASSIEGFSEKRWLTFNQAKELGGMVRKGESATRLTAFNLVKLDKDGKRLPVDAPEHLVDKIIPFAKTVCVFNADQVEGIELDAELIEADVSLDFGDKLFAKSGAKVVEGTSAYFAPHEDCITLPKVRFFQGEEAQGHFWATAFHELVHWTGHESRLNRKMGRDKEGYAFEELVAEIGASFLCAHAGIKGELRHADYIGSWLKALKDDKKFIFEAAKQAQQAVDYLLELAGESH